MNADGARREEIAKAGQRIEAFLQTLSPEGLARQSACVGWTVGDVVGHLIERGDPLPDQIERGLAGDLSPTPGFTDDPPISEDQFRINLDRRAVELRQELGDRLTAEFARVNGEFNRVLSLLQPEDWDKLCFHRLRPETVRSKADIRIAELAMHEWDMRWAFDPDAELAEDSLPGLVNASGRGAQGVQGRSGERADGALPVRSQRADGAVGGCGAGTGGGEFRDRGIVGAGRGISLRAGDLRVGDFWPVETAGSHREWQVDGRW